MRPQADLRPTFFGQISAWQLVLLLATVGTTAESTGLNSMLSPLLGPDVWLAFLLALPFAAGEIWILGVLSQRHPGKNLFELLESSLGFWGTLLIAAYVLLFGLQTVVSAQEFALLSKLIFTFTPSWVLLAPMFALTLYGNLLGLEVVARINALLFAVVDLPLGILLAILFAPQQRLARLMPVFVAQPTHLWLGTALVVGMFATFVAMPILLPHVKQLRLAARLTLWLVLIVTFTALGHNLGPFLVFGRAAEDMTWPVYTQVTVLQVGRVLERVDVLAIILWVHGFWITLSLFTRLSTIGLAKILRLPEARTVLAPLTSFLYVLSAFVLPNANAVIALNADAYLYGFLPLGFVLPGILLLFPRRHGLQSNRTQ